MPRNRRAVVQSTGYRSGQFEFEGAASTGTERRILDGRSQAYRILNTGKYPFQVRTKEGDGTATWTVSVEPDCSVDISTRKTGPNKAYLGIYAAAGVAVKGVYEILGSERTKTAGRLKLDATQRAFLWLQGGKKLGSACLYRVINADDKTSVTIYGLSEDIVVAPKASVDFACVETQVLAAGDGASLVYANLEDDEAARSGRFSKVTAAQKVIRELNYLGDSKTKACYRITNTAKGPDGNNPKVIAIVVEDADPIELAPKCSVDIVIDGATYVTVAAHSGSNEVEGVYDLIDLFS